MRDMTPDTIQEFILEQGKRGLSAQTIRNNLTPLGPLLKHAVKWGSLRTSPMPFVDLPRIKRKEMAFLPADQTLRFLEHVPKHWYPGVRESKGVANGNEAEEGREV